MIGVEPPRGIYSHIVGIDLVRTEPRTSSSCSRTTARTPSGVSYMLENRESMMQMFPELFARNRVAPVDDYPDELRRRCETSRPAGCDGDPTRRRC